jgi:hypothetical protein
LAITAPGLARAERCTGAQRCIGKNPGDYRIETRSRPVLVLPSGRTRADFRPGRLDLDFHFSHFDAVLSFLLSLFLHLP